MQNTSTPEPQPSHPATSDLLAQLSGQPPNRNAGQGLDAAQIAALLQQQGAVPTGMNVTDPAAQAHVWNILSQMGTQAWGSANQASNSQTLESILASISRQPEIAANLLSSFTGNMAGQQQQQAQLKPEGASQAQLDAGSYTAQLYGSSGTGLAPDSEGKGDGSGDLAAAAAAAMEQDPTLTKANSVKCAKEKNRQAQRRFRERQKGLIQALKERADSLQKQVEDQRRQIETLEKENQVLKVILQDKKN